MDTNSFIRAKHHIYGLAHDIGKNRTEQNELITALQNMEIACINLGDDNEKIIWCLLDRILDELKKKHLRKMNSPFGEDNA